MVYLILNSKEEVCKIGVSDNPEKRLEILQTGSPYTLTLLAAIEGDFITEKELHLKFANSRIRGEWFRFDDDIKEFFSVDDFFSMSAKFLLDLTFLPESATKLFLTLLRAFDVEEEIMFTEFDIKLICNDLHITKDTFKKSLIELLVAKYVLLLKTDDYRINPEFVFRGSLINRNKIISILKSQAQKINKKVIEKIQNTL